MKTLEEIKSAINLIVQKTGIDGGYAILYRTGKPFASVIFSTGGGWDHVSVCPFKHSYVPTWEDMCDLKEKFFYDEDVVVQFHPAKSEYVNNMRNCLHLWRSTEQPMPTPPSIFVGVRDGQSVAEVREEINKYI